MSQERTRPVTNVKLETAPESTNLATLDTLKLQLSITVATHDAYLTDLIEQASNRIYHELGRPLYRAQWKETFAGNGMKRYVAARYPIASVDSITYMGDAQTLADFDLEDRDAGFLYATTGWFKSDDPAAWEIVYTAGYFLPDDQLTGAAIAVNGTSEAFTSSALFHGQIKADDWLYVSGFSTEANNGNHIISSGTASSIVTTSDLTTESAPGGGVAMRLFPEAPGLYERACLDLAAATYSRSTAALSGARSVKVGDVTVQFQEKDVHTALGSL